MRVNNFSEESWMFDNEDRALLALDSRWHQRRMIAMSLRQLNQLTLTTDAHSDLLDEIGQNLLRLVSHFDGVAPLQGRSAHTAEMELAGPANRLALELSHVIGRSSGAGLPMKLALDKGRISAEIRPQWVHEGPAGWMHGGLIACLFDEFLGLAQGELGADPGKTGALTVRYLAPTPLDMPLQIIVTSARQERRKRFIAGELWAGDQHTATAEAIFVVPVENAGEYVTASSDADPSVSE